MIKLISKSVNPLFINLQVDDGKNCGECLLLWETDQYKSIIFSENIKFTENVSYFSQLNKGIDFFNQNINFKIIRLSDYNVLFEEKFINLSFLSGNKIFYVSQNGHTGYAYAARNYIYQLITEKYDVSWDVSTFYKTTYTPSNQHEKIVFNVLDRELPDNKYDSMIIHSTPDCWSNMIDKLLQKKSVKKIYGLTTWETTRLNKNWVDLINESKVDGVIVHSKFNYDVFTDSGVKKPIYVWYPDIFPIDDKETLLNQNIFSKLLLFKNKKYEKNVDNNIKKLFSDNTVYYNISQYTERKNLDQLVRVFCKKFTSKDKVCLFVKTFFKDFEPTQIEYLKYKFYNIIKNYENPPNIVFCFEDLNDTQIQSIHMFGDVYITLNRGEGFGLCSYTAKKFGNKVICGKFGSEMEFLSNEDILIDVSLGNTFNMIHFHNYYDGKDQKWAIYNDDEVFKKLIYLPKTIK